MYNASVVVPGLGCNQKEKKLSQNMLYIQNVVLYYILIESIFALVEL